MEKIKIGIIGTGHLGKLHVKMFKQVFECEVIGLYDSNVQTAKEVAQEFNVKVFDTLDELLNEIQAASIAVNTSSARSSALKINPFPRKVNCATCRSEALRADLA
jgi:predicted dehydrogenase